VLSKSSIDRDTCKASRYLVGLKDCFWELFILTVGTILAIVGFAKIRALFGDAKILGACDPIIGIQFRHLMLAVGSIEIVLCLLCFLGKRPILIVTVIAWLATNLAVYRVGLWWMGWHRPCGCLGNLTDALHISARTADNIMKAVLAYLLIGSYGLLTLAAAQAVES
jgi:hypothetical protein